MSIFKKLFSSITNNESKKSTDFSEGDIFYTFLNNQYHTYKILSYDRRFNIYHVLSYKSSDIIPNKKSIDTFEVQVYHIPIDKNGFENTVFLENRNITSEDLIGYHEYLRQTQEISNYIPLANQYYQIALKLTDEKKHKEAIDSYSKAIDLIPNFFEAIDNKAFCKMDLGFWEEAIKGFEESLKVNPDSLLAVFSIGECYLRLKNYPKAKEQFEKAIKIDPSYQPSKDFLKKVNDLIATL